MEEKCWDLFLAQNKKLNYWRKTTIASSKTQHVNRILNLTFTVIFQTFGKLTFSAGPAKSTNKMDFMK